jgi:hypothetical protein
MQVRRTRIFGALVSCAAAVAMALPSAASAVPAGFDLFETSPQDTTIDFNMAPIPPGFFGPMSDPFMGIVHLGGQHLGQFMGKDSGDADTVVQRLANANLGPGFPDSDTIPIEIVMLSLVSVEPITVTYNGGQNPEFWDITVGLLPSPAGQMQITQTSSQGGTFNTLQLPVVPRVSFTRIPDGQEQPLPPGPPIVFQSFNSPWRAGCAPPALAIPNLNDDFCPGLTPDGQKKLTVEQAALATHGVYPAQPRIEHFQCYTVRRARFLPRRVRLLDQFGTRRARVAKRRELCNPTQKNQEPFLNGRSHLQCYATTGPAVNRQVAVRNQFGSQRLQVGQPTRLCLPSRKHKPGKRFQGLTAAQRIDHYQCYAVTPLTPLRGPTPQQIIVADLTDQFGLHRASNLQLLRLCAPVSKNRGVIQHKVKHLVCYGFQHPRVRRTYYIRNQFELRKLRTVRPQSLCVPSDKLLLP